MAVQVLSDGRRFVRLTEGAPPLEPTFPTASLDNGFAVEAHSGRVLGIRSGRGVWALAPGGQRFAAHRPEQWPKLGFLRTRTIAYVPAWRATVPGPDGHPLGDVTRVAAAPGRGRGRDGRRRIWPVTGEHGQTRTGPLFAGWVAGVLPLPRPGAFLVQSSFGAHLLTLPPDAEATGEATGEEVERAPPCLPPAGYRRLAPGTGEYLVYIPVAQRGRIPAGAGLFRLDGLRFVPVPGGDAAALGREARFFAVPSRGLVIARSQGGRLFVYRDGALAPVPDSDRARLSTARSTTSRSSGVCWSICRGKRSN